MPTELTKFGDAAKKLSVNPLGIIALFIVLVYGISALVLGFSSSDLHPEERLPLIWFLVAFPPIVLLTFAWLVTNHHTKLYAPRDFPDPSHFLQALGPVQQRKKLESEVALIQGKEFEFGTARMQTPINTPRNVLMARVILAEDLVMRELSSEYGVYIRRQMAMGKDMGRDIGIDGMFVKKDEGFAIEVKVFRNAKTVRSIVESLRGVRDHINQLGWKRINFILAAVIDVTENQDVTHVKELIQESVDDLEAEIQIRYFLYSELSAKYGASLPTDT